MAKIHRYLVFFLIFFLFFGRYLVFKKERGKKGKKSYLFCRTCPSLEYSKVQFSKLSMRYSFIHWFTRSFIHGIISVHQTYTPYPALQVGDAGGRKMTKTALGCALTKPKSRTGGDRQ